MDKKVKNYWSKEKSMQFKSRNEFKINQKGAYDAARRNGWLDEISGHMNSKTFRKYGINQINKKSTKFWTKERCRDEANKYDERKKFMVDSPSAYSVCLEMGWLKELAGHQRLMKTKWTKTDCINIAKKCKTFNDFRKNNSAYLAARRNRWMDEIKILFPIKRETKWCNKQVVIDEAKKYMTRNEFRKKAKGAFESAYKNNWLKDACSHMKSPIFYKYNVTQIDSSSLKYWTFERCKKEAIKYNTRREFVLKSPSAYNIACKNGWLKQIASHQDLHNKSWTKEECHLLALNFSNKKDFIQAHKGAYIFSLRRGWKDEICSHMNINLISWSKQMCEKEAMRFKTKKEFRDGSPKAYAYAQQNKLLDEICTHMIPIGNIFNRMVYCYEFLDNTVYIGITYNEEKRKSEHLNNKRGPVAEYMVYSGLKPIYKKLCGYLEVKLAQVKEQDYIDMYKKKGWKVLNSSKGGALGGNKRKWTKEEILRVSKLYKRKIDFQKSIKHYTAYNAARKMGILEEVCKDMIGKRYWTKGEVLVEAKKYGSMSEFMKNSGGAYNYASRNKFRDQIIFKKK